MIPSKYTLLIFIIICTNYLVFFLIGIAIFQLAFYSVKNILCWQNKSDLTEFVRNKNLKYDS